MRSRVLMAGRLATGIANTLETILKLLLESIRHKWSMPLCGDVPLPVENREAGAFRSASVAFNSGSCSWALSRRNPLAASCMAAPAQRRAIDGDRQYFTFFNARRHRVERRLAYGRLDDGSIS
jgi:hypothetical protein